MKQKSHSGAKKRFTKTGSGKVKHRKAAKSHLLFSKSKRQKKYGRKGVLLHESNEKRVKELLPYAG